MQLQHKRHAHELIPMDAAIICPHQPKFDGCTATEGEWGSPGRCRVCWLWHNDQHYRDVWSDGAGIQRTSIRCRRPCWCDKEGCHWCHVYHEQSLRGTAFRKAWGCAEPPPLPGLVRRVGNFARALMRHAIDWRKETPENQQERLRVCLACDQLGEDGVCHHPKCGCTNMDVKRAWTSEKCPLGKWPGEANYVPLPTIDLKTYFHRVVIIHIPSRTDRMERIQKQIASPNWPFADPVIVRAIDTKSGAVPLPRGWGAGSGAAGCLRSHQRVLEDAMLDGVENLLVLEDDFVLGHDFPARLAAFLASVPNDWEQLMLGGQHMRQPEPVVPGVVRCIDCQRTHAYAVRGQYMRDLYSMWTSRESWDHCDHTMGPFQTNRRVYAPEHFIVGQGGDHSDICQGAHLPIQTWNAPTGHEPIIIAKVPRQVMEELKGHGWYLGRFFEPDGTALGFNAIMAAPDREQKLRDWIHGNRGTNQFSLMWETVSLQHTTQPNAMLTLWHPELTIDMVRPLWTGPAYEVVAETIEEALAMLTEKKQSDTMIHEHGYWLTEDGHEFDGPLCDALIMFFKNELVATITDMGCGPGAYVRRFNESKLYATGYDGNPNTKEAMVFMVDLAEPQKLRTSDWSLSLEVGEHIPQQYEQIFLDNVANHASMGVVLSWAVPDQPGRGHVNCRTNEYVKAEMDKRGFVHDDRAATTLRAAATKWWFKNTLMVFRRKPA